MEGVLSNRDGVGSRIEVYADGMQQTRFTHCGIGFLGQNSSTEIFGFGNTAQADSILIHWPTGHIDRLFDVATGQKLEIVEGSTTEGEINVDPDVVIILSDESVLQQEDEKMVLFPNPVINTLKVQIPASKMKEGHLFITDLQGRVLLSKTTINEETIELELPHLNSGIYQLTWVSKDRKTNSTTSFIKQ